MKKFLLKIMYVFYNYFHKQNDVDPYLGAIAVFLLILASKLIVIFVGIWDIELIPNYSKDDRWKLYVYGFPVYIVLGWLVHKYVPKNEILALEISQEEHSHWKVGVLVYLILFFIFLLFGAFYFRGK